MTKLFYWIYGAIIGIVASPFFWHWVS